MITLNNSKSRMVDKLDIFLRKLTNVCLTRNFDEFDEDKRTTLSNCLVYHSQKKLANEFERQTNARFWRFGVSFTRHQRIGWCN